MALCRFTDLHNNNQAIYINPEHVIAVQSISNQTWIITTAMNPNGSSRVAHVLEPADQVVETLDGARR